MTEVAGEVCDGFLCHGFTTERYLREVTIPALERGRAKAGKTMDGFEIVGPSFVVTGTNDEELDAAASRHPPADRLLRLDAGVQAGARAARLGRPPGGAQRAVEAGRVGADGQADRRRDPQHVRRRRPARADRAPSCTAATATSSTASRSTPRTSPTPPAGPRSSRTSSPPDPTVVIANCSRKRPCEWSILVNSSRERRSASSGGGGAREPGAHVGAEGVVGVAALLEHDERAAEGGDGGAAAAEALGASGRGRTSGRRRRCRRRARRRRRPGRRRRRRRAPRRARRGRRRRRCRRRSGTLQVAPLPRPAPVSSAWPGVVRVGPHRVAVQRHERHVVALVEDLLRAVAVVVVDVEHGDPRARRGGDVGGGDRGVVEEAVPAVQRRRGVVARRPAQPVGDAARRRARRRSRRARSRPPSGPPRTCPRSAASWSRSTTSRGGRRRSPARPSRPSRPAARAGRTRRGRRRGPAGRRAGTPPTPTPGSARDPGRGRPRSAPSRPAAARRS